MPYSTFWTRGLARGANPANLSNSHHSSPPLTQNIPLIKFNLSRASQLIKLISQMCLRFPRFSSQLLSSDIFVVYLRRCKKCALTVRLTRAEEKFVRGKSLPLGICANLPTNLKPLQKRRNPKRSVRQIFEAMKMFEAQVMARE